MVAKIDKQFDEMWNSQWAIPISALVTFTLSEQEVLDKYQGLQTYAENMENWPYPLPDGRAGRQSLIDGWFDTATWAPAEFVYNPPEITGGDEVNGTVIADHLIGLLNESENEILVESAYFIITDETLQRVDPLLAPRRTGF